MNLRSFSAEHPVDVCAVYRDGVDHPLPQVLWWNGQRYTVSTIDFVYPERQGETRFVCYFLTCGRTSFRVRLNTQRQRWLACTTTEAR